MNLPEHLKSKSTGELEEWFLEGLELDPMPAGDMLAVLREIRKAGAGAQAYSWADLLQDALAERGDREQSLRLLTLRLKWHGENAEFRATCRDVAARAFSDRIGMAFVKAVGLNGDLALGECLRRLDVLLRLKPGCLCHDKTWGFGVVKRLDDFYEKVAIDFRKKPGHQMSFAYAAETLEVIGEAHLQSRLYRDAAALQALVADDAAEVVRIALRSHGPLSADGLKEVLLDGIVDETRWKEFWDRARKELKRDSLVNVPARRSEPIRLLSSEQSYDEEWFEALAGERDPQSILDRAREIARDACVDELPAEFRDTLRGRLAFVTWSMENSAPHLSARAVLLAAQLGLAEPGAELDKQLNDLRAPRRLATALHGLPVRELEPFLRVLFEQDAALTGERLINRMTDMSVSVLNVVLDMLAANGARDACAREIRRQLGEREPPMPLLYWLCRHATEFERWELGLRYDLLKHVFDGMQRTQSGNALKAQNRLKLLIRRPEWLKDWLSAMTDAQRRMLMGQANSAQGWDPPERRSVMAAMIKLYPDLSDVVRGESEAASEQPTGRWTSRRSYAERREQLRRLNEVEIPENSREIGVARSYGDLRENAEYQAARDHQGILMRRKAEIERDLEQVRATDFRGVPTDRAGMGTCVTLERDGGERRTYNLLGEWDRDEERSIISSRSRLAEILDGKRVGAAVALPGEHADAMWRIAGVAAVGDEIRAWIEGDGSRGLATSTQTE